MGIRGVVGDLISSYPSKRKQIVAFGKKTCKTSQISMGVSPGSILGPLLFLLYINDTASCFSTPKESVGFYADDSCVTVNSK